MPEVHRSGGFRGTRGGAEPGGAHQVKKRNRKLVEQPRAMAGAVLKCEMSDLVRVVKYPCVGDGFIECHHTVPVSQMKAGKRRR